MSQNPESGAENKRPRNRLSFSCGVALTALGLGCLAISAFADSGAVNALSICLLPGAAMAIYGWRGPDRA